MNRPGLINTNTKSNQPTQMSTSYVHSQTNTMTNAVYMSATNTLFPGVDSSAYSRRRTTWRLTAVRGCEIPTKNMTMRDLMGEKRVVSLAIKRRNLQELRETHHRSLPGEPNAQNHELTVWQAATARMYDKYLADSFGPICFEHG